MKDSSVKGYQDRVQRLFSRVNNIQSLNKEEKIEKLKDFENIVLELEQKIQIQKSEKSGKLSMFKEALGQIQAEVENE